MTTFNAIWPVFAPFFLILCCLCLIWNLWDLVRAFRKDVWRWWISNRRVM